MMASDLSITSFSIAFEELMTMKGDGRKVIYLVCNPFGSTVAVKVLNEVAGGYGVTANVAFLVRYADYLDDNAWFLTDGEFMVFNSGV